MSAVAASFREATGGGGTGGRRKTEANQTMDNAPMVQLMGGEDHVSERLARIVHQVHTGKWYSCSSPVLCLIL